MISRSSPSSVIARTAVIGPRLLAGAVDSPDERPLGSVPAGASCGRSLPRRRPELDLAGSSTGVACCGSPERRNTVFRGRSAIFEAGGVSRGILARRTFIALGLACCTIGLVAGAAIQHARPAGAAPRFASHGLKSGHGLRALSPDAQSALSAAVGKASTSFAARDTAGGYRLRGGGVTADLGARDVTLRAPDGDLSFALAGSRPRGAARRSGRGEARRARQPRVAGARRRDGVVRGRPARHRAGLHALAAPGRSDRSGHARAAPRGRRTRAPRRDGHGPPRRGPAGSG